MDEGVVGISAYFTSAPGLGGRIKASAEDFVVDEGSVDLPRSEEGRYTAARIRTRNWETNRPRRGPAPPLPLHPKKVCVRGGKARRSGAAAVVGFRGPAD